MTPREIIIANLEHKNPPRPGMTFDNGRVNDFMFACPDNSHLPQPKRWVEGKKEFYYDIWGNLWSRMVDGCIKGEIHTPFLTSWDKLDSLVPPDSSDERLYKRMAEKFASCTDKFKVAGIGGWIFDSARYLRKMENYFMDMIAHAKELKQLHSIVCKVYEDRIHGAGKAGADAIFIGEDMGTQQGLLFSPELFGEFFKADYTRLLDIAHSYGMKVMLHSCGQNTEIIDDLIDAGVDCFQFDQPALYDMNALAEKFKARKASLYSPTDIQKIMPTGDKEYIQAQTQIMLETFNGFLITKNYPDLPGIGVDPQWDQWAYETVCDFANIKP